MAQRSRKYVVQYGGERCGRANDGNKFTPIVLGTHSCSDETHHGPPYRTGGPLLVKKKKVSIKRFPPFHVFYSASFGSYDGYMGVRPYIPPVEPTPSSLAGWGAKGWARTQPLHPIYNLGVSLIELRDLGNMVSQVRRGFGALSRAPEAFALALSSVSDFLFDFKTFASRVGSSYLFGAFGVWPMVQDLLFLLRMRQKLAQKLRWLRNHRNKSVRRKVVLDAGGFSENVDRFIAPSSACFPTLSTYLYKGGQITSVQMPIRKTYTRKIWYAAKYRFFIPDIPDWLFEEPPFGGTVQNLLGLTVNPSVLWQAMPWSWLLNWFFSVGDVLANISSVASLSVIAEYAYVMCEEHFEYVCPGHVLMNSGNRIGLGTTFDGPTKSFNGNSVTTYELKNREVANPFGFGFTFASLSAYQWSILAALGLSGGGKHSSPRP